jgi:two-component system phosphate regulon sensor histidine kinase PhoR
MDRFLNQLETVAELAERGIPGERIALFKDKRLGDAAQSLNDMMEMIADRTQTLREDRDKFVSILDEFSDGILAVDVDERIIYMNQRSRELLKINAESVQEKLISEVTRVDDVQSAITDCLENVESVHREGRRVDPDDELILTIDASPLRNASGKVIGAVASIHDVTELRRLQTVRQDFVANVSHELKTPITAIQGLIETLAGDDSMDADTRQRFIKKVRNQTRRMSTLVEDLLTISRLESDDEILEARRFDLVEPVNEALETLQPKADKREHEIIVDVPDDAIYIEGDPAAVRQLTTNLLENAVKYTPKSGEIRLTVEQENGDATIVVEDNGPGIEPRKQERIFERFYRVDDARTREAGGTGLGLAIVKHLTLTLDGEIQVDSTPGRGSTFTVKLPTLSESE